MACKISYNHSWAYNFVVANHHFENNFNRDLDNAFPYEIWFSFISSGTFKFCLLTTKTKRKKQTQMNILTTMSFCCCRWRKHFTCHLHNDHWVVNRSVWFHSTRIIMIIFYSTPFLCLIARSQIWYYNSALFFRVPDWVSYSARTKKI